MRCVALLGAILAISTLLAFAGTGVASAATTWVVHLVTGSSGQSHAQALPTAPGGVSAACAAPTTSSTIKVTWTAVTHATSYTIYQSTTSATSGFSSVASGIATTSWTSGTLTSGKQYWYEVATKFGSNWLGATSSASGSSTIHTITPFCTQP